jgi:hypothetical protein
MMEVIDVIFGRSKEDICRSIKGYWLQEVGIDKFVERVDILLK